MTPTQIYQQYSELRCKEKAGEVKPGSAFLFYRKNSSALNSLRTDAVPVAANNTGNAWDTYSALRQKEKEGLVTPGSSFVFYQAHKDELNSQRAA